MLNISSIKKLLHKPSEIQWNLTGTLSWKLKQKFFGLYPTRYYPLKSQKCEKLLFWGVLLGPGNQCGIQWFFMILWISESFSLYLLVKNSFNFKLGFFTCFEYTSAGIIRKTFCIQITIVPGDIDAKKTRKTFHKLQIYKFFSQCLIVISSLLWAFMVQSNCKKSFSRGKSRKNDIPVLKITFSLQKMPQNYRFLWVKTKTIEFS